MFRWSALVPFAEGEICQLTARRSVLSARGEAEVRQVTDRQLVFAANIPKQGIVIPAMRILYRYRYAGDGKGLVLIRLNGKTYSDENATIRPSEDGRAVDVEMLYDAGKNIRLAYRLVRTADDELAVENIRGHPLVSGASMRLARRAAAAA